MMNKAKTKGGGGGSGKVEWGHEEGGGGPRTKANTDF